MADKYTFTIGRRKTSTATIRLFEGTGKNMVNDKPVEVLYPHKYEIVQMTSPFGAANLDAKKFYFTAMVKGGGKISQLGAVKLALARAIAKQFPELKKDLKVAKLLTRDPRMVERKKPGLHKARKAEQYSKR
jgi:small subunit ribosomal protein S9